eukprot:169201-Prymnesium_polylepis.1
MQARKQRLPSLALNQARVRTPAMEERRPPAGSRPPTCGARMRRSASFSPFSLISPIFANLWPAYPRDRP